MPKSSTTRTNPQQNMAVCRCRLYLFINLTIIFVYPFAAHSCTRLPLICFILLFLFVAPFAAYSCTRVPLIVCRWISKFNAFRNSNALSDGALPYGLPLSHREKENAALSALWQVLVCLMLGLHQYSQRRQPISAFWKYTVAPY